MAPQSLYRKHRPQRFAELVGQEHVSTALRNAVREERVGHAYLFSGPRGTGKTTTARLLAKSLNCLDLAPDGEPCGKCDNCEAIATGTFYDLAELDAASNNGVDAIRDLVQSVGLGLGASSRRKVYIVDEVHMLSTAASNALLKTLEEPPEHVVFVLATTDPGKVLPTIRSRTQHFEFSLLTHDQIVGHLADVLAREGVEPDDDVLDLVARRAAGSARDALSLLDQALALGEDRHLDAARVRDALGDTPFERRTAILEAIAAEDGACVLLGVAATLADGVAPRQLADDLLRTMRDAFVLDAGAGRVAHDGPAEEAERLGALAAALGRPLLTRGIETLGQAIVDIRGPAVPDPRLVLEVAVLRLTRRDSRGGADALLERVERLERQVADLRSGGVGAQPALGAPHAPAPAKSHAQAPAPAPGAAAPGDVAQGTGAPAPRRALGAFRDAAASVGDAGPGAQVPATADAALGTGEADLQDATKGAEAAAPGPAHSFDLDDVVEAWPVAMGALSPPLRAAIQDAQPISVEGSVVIFGVPPKRLDAIRNRFQSEADTIRASLAAGLGGVPQFKLRAHDFDAPGAFRPAAAGATGAATTGPVGATGSATADAAGTEAPDDPEDPGYPDDEHVDLADLVDAPPGPPSFEPTAALRAQLGAQIVEERPRE